jgi:hypothetical protein
MDGYMQEQEMESAPPQAIFKSTNELERRRDDSGDVYKGGRESLRTRFLM